jgi:hypothetical protein
MSGPPRERLQRTYRLRGCPGVRVSDKLYLELSRINSTPSDSVIEFSLDKYRSGIYITLTVHGMSSVLVL